MARQQLSQLYYITHIENLPSILKLGILSHEQVEAQAVDFTAIYDAQIVASRRGVSAPNGKSLWSFANLYFQPRNAMLYRVVCEKPTEDIAVVAVRADILNRADIFIATGNAASQQSEILPANEGRKTIPQIRREIDKEYWTEEDGSKRKMMAESLVPDCVPPESIQSVYVASHGAAQRAQDIMRSAKFLGIAPPVIPEPHMFFRPPRVVTLPGTSISLAEGDMFFSRMHTLTVSVNTVGVMGKGLASRAKYQFPDVYVVYQDVCRSRSLRMGRPYLYKRESSLDYQLADDPGTLTNGMPSTWFLLFPTKRHWREMADIAGIEQGLEWVIDHCIAEGVNSLALPALGCGLGRLDWRDVGPLMCRYLCKLDIPIRIYLPAERRIPEESLTREFLLA